MIARILNVERKECMVPYKMNKICSIIWISCSFVQHKHERASAEKIRGGQRKKVQKIANKIENSTIKPLPRGGGNGKKDQKIALFSFYLQYLYHVGKSRGATAPLPSTADAHASTVYST